MDTAAFNILWASEQQAWDSLGTLSLRRVQEETKCTRNKFKVYLYLPVVH